MRVEVTITGADRIMHLLHNLPYEVVSRRGGPAKLALAKGARLLRDQARSNLQAAIALGGDQSSGLLVQNVVATRGKPPAAGRGERYLVRVRRKTYPGRAGQPVTTRKTASLLEYGSSQQTATPWLRPAVAARGQEIINVITDDLLRRVERIAAGLGGGF